MGRWSFGTRSRPSPGDDRPGLTNAMPKPAGDPPGTDARRAVVTRKWAEGAATGACEGMAQSPGDRGVVPRGRGARRRAAGCDAGRARNRSHGRAPDDRVKLGIYGEWGRRRSEGRSRLESPSGVERRAGGGSDRLASGRGRGGPRLGARGRRGLAARRCGEREDAGADRDGGRRQTDRPARRPGGERPGGSGAGASPTHAGPVAINRGGRAAGLGHAERRAGRRRPATGSCRRVPSCRSPSG